MSDFSTGLLISVVGLLVTFVALGIFIGVIYLLRVLFPYKPEAAKGEEESGEEGEELPAESETDAEALVAALAAVAYAKESQTGKPAESKNPIWTSR